MTPVYSDSVLSCLLVCVCISSLLFVQVDCVYRYERVNLLCIFSTMNCEYRPKRLCDPRKLSAEPHWLTSHSHRHTCRGRRASALVKFRRRNLRPPLPCVFLSNVHSLKNKADELFFLIQSNQDFKDCSVFCFTETWLDPSIPDSAVQPLGYTLFRADSSPVLSNKSRGGGIRFLVNQRWCSNADVLSTSCSPELETLTVRCRPFYSPRKFSCYSCWCLHTSPGQR